MMSIVGASKKEYVDQAINVLMDVHVLENGTEGSEILNHNSMYMCSVIRIDAFNNMSVDGSTVQLH